MEQGRWTSDSGNEWYIIRAWSFWSGLVVTADHTFRAGKCQGHGDTMESFLGADTTCIAILTILYCDSLLSLRVCSVQTGQV